MDKQAVFIYGVAKGSILPESLPLTLKAVTLAHRWHEGHKRDDGSDYVDHLLSVCNTLLIHRIQDDITLAASLGHDSKEERGITLEELVDELGEEVANLIDRVTKRKGESIEEFYGRIKKDIRAIIIKAADRTHNTGNMIKVYSIERLERYVKETEEYVLPMMKDARRFYLAYSDALVAFNDHIVDVIKVVKAYVDKSKECDNLRKKIKQLKQKSKGV